MRTEIFLELVRQVEWHTKCTGVGDSPIIGAGLYVDNEIGAATATGHGEEVIRIAGSHLVVELMRQGYSQKMRVRKLYIELLS
jgi:isoaspartyl peptidase/L-asparaginase-like protein (Ntn-hydrolase superfamily)